MPYSPLQEGNRSLGAGALEAAPGDHVHDGGTSRGPVEFTPVWSSTGTQPVVGNGTLYGRYALHGKMVHLYIELTMGSTTTYGTGEYRFSIPIVPENRLWCLPGLAMDSGVGYEEITGVVRDGVSLVVLRTLTAVGSTLAVVNSTTPITFGTADKITVQGTYGY